MNCKTTEAKLSQFIDNELAEQESFLVQQHLEKCQSCQAQLQALIDVKEVIHSYQGPALSLDFDYSLQQKINSLASAQIKQEIKKGNKYKQVALAASLAFIMPLAYLYQFHLAVDSNVGNHTSVVVQNIEQFNQDFLLYTQEKENNCLSSVQCESASYHQNLAMVKQL